MHLVYLSLSLYVCYGQKFVVSGWIRNTAKNFYAASLFLDVCKQFGELEPEVRILGLYFFDTVLHYRGNVNEKYYGKRLTHSAPRNAEVRQMEDGRHNESAKGWPDAYSG